MGRVLARFRGPCVTFPRPEEQERQAIGDALVTGMIVGVPQDCPALTSGCRKASAPIPDLGDNPLTSPGYLL